MQSVNERLKWLRKTILGFTQNELGKSIGITGFTISDIEKGKLGLTERNLTAICEKHNINRDWLLTGNGDPIIKPDEENKFLNAITKATNNNDTLLQSIVTAYDSLSDKGKNYIYEFIKNIYENLSESEKTNKSINQSSTNQHNEISATEENQETGKIPPEYKNMSVEELLKQSNIIENLLEKKQKEELLSLQKQNENIEIKDQRNSKIS